MRIGCYILLVLVFVSGGWLLGEGHQSPLGYPVEINDLYIPGGKAEPIPRKDQSASLVIRVLEVKPAQDGFRYDLSVYGLDAGDHNLLDYLQYVGSEKPIEAEPVVIKITNKHSLDQLPKPIELQPSKLRKLGGYRTLMIVLGIAWLVGLFILLFYRRKSDSNIQDVEPEPTLHEKLYRLVSAASKGELSEAEQANLERLIIGHWKQEIPELESLSPARAISKLRTHSEASPLILKLEHWLHAPQGSINQREIEPLLAPFAEPGSD